MLHKLSDESITVTATVLSLFGRSYLVEVTESSRARKYNYRSYSSPRSCREDVKALVVRVVASFSFFCKQDTSSRSSVQDDTISQTTFVRTLLVADD